MKQYKMEDSLGYIVAMASKSMGHRLNRHFSESGYDITVEQWAVLAHLWQKDGQCQQHLADRTCKDKTSITRLVDGLEKRSLVVRIPDKKDRRQNLIYLTSQGKEIQKNLTPLAQLTLKEGQKGVKAAQMNICKNVLRQVCKNLMET